MSATDPSESSRLRKLVVVAVVVMVVVAFLVSQRNRTPGLEPPF